MNVRESQHRWVGRPPCAPKVVQKKICCYLCCIMMLISFSSYYISSSDRKFAAVIRCFDLSGHGSVIAGSLFWQQSICCREDSSGVVVAISRIEIQASWGSPGWSASWLWVSVKNGERGASEGSAQLSSAHWSAQETPGMGTHQEAQTSACGGNLLTKPDSRENIQDASGFTKRYKTKLMHLYVWAKKGLFVVSKVLTKKGKIRAPVIKVI